MRIYRYEKEDGGGPWFTRDGNMRGRPPNFPIEYNDDYLYGCSSIEKLNNYFVNQQDLIKDCKIRAYEVSIVDLEEKEDHFKFRKEDGKLIY